MRLARHKIAPRLAVLAPCSTACATSFPRRSPLGETLPAVEGQALDGVAHRLPEDLLGAPSLVLLLDADGRVAFFHDEGYSVAALTRLQQTLATLREPS